MARSFRRQRAAGDTLHMVGGSLLFGAARELRRDLLGTFERAMLDHNGEPVRIRIGPPRIGFLVDVVLSPEGARQVLATDAAHYDKDVPPLVEFRRFVGEGLLTSDGDRWRRDRRIVAPLFTRKRVASYVGSMADAAGRLVRAARARRTVWDFVEELIARRRGEVAAGLDANDESLDRGDLLGLLLTAQDPETRAGLDDLAVRDQALIFLLAGHETTGATLAFALHLLGRHPALQQRVRDEVRRVTADRPIEAADIEHLTYTSQVLDETMRLYPAGHTLARRAREAGVLAGHDITARRIVAISVWAIHHNPAVWPDPYRFDPDRFDRREAADDGERSGPGRYAHLPFGGGPRACIGQYLAMAEMTVAVATIVRGFELESLVEEPELDVGVSLLPGGRLPCRLRPVGSPPAL